MKKLIALTALFIPLFVSNAQAWGSSAAKKLYTAARSGDLRTIEEHLMSGHSIDELDSDGNTALCLASWDYSQYAYDVLISYGANPKVKCMEKSTDDEKVFRFAHDYDGYIAGGAIALGVGGLIALSRSGGNNHDPEPGPEPGPSGDNVFQDDAEYHATKYVREYNAVNFLDSAGAMKAYNKFYSYDEHNNLITTLSGYSTVGIIDTGVDGSHSEFKDNYGNSKITGHSFDYGPCKGVDTKNCWKFVGSAGSTLSYMTFYDATGTDTGNIYLVTADEYEEWADLYPSEYDWDTYKSREDSFYPITAAVENPLTGGLYAHGTHIAGIMVADHDKNGIMGIAFTNTSVKAVRWDLVSTFYDPVRVLVDDKVDAINISIGTDANDASSSKNYELAPVYVKDWVDAAAYTISNYDTSGAYKEGSIWVKAAGNDGYTYPDLASGIKLIDTYSDLMMMVVVNADVKLNSDGTVNSYKLDATSNRCGNTSGYCIAAPGTLLASTDIGNEYIMMGGTSQAAPVVTGAIAFLKSAFPTLRSEQIIDLLMNTANKNATDYSPEIYGAGLLDLGAAVEYQSPVAGTSSIFTVKGDDLSSSSYVRLDNASLVVPSTMADALKRALPETITAFDAYDRPYEYPTASYIHSTHASYKNFKNDVNHIIPSRKKQNIQKGNFSLAFNAGGTDKNPLNFVFAQHTNGNHTNGFYFSQNSKYQNISGKHADLNNPFMAFNSAYGYTYGYKLNSKLNFNMEVAGGENGLYDGDHDYNDRRFKKQAYGFNSGIDYKHTKNLKFGITSGILRENDALLGANGENAFALSGGQTYHFGLNAAWDIKPKWTLSASYYQGYTEAQKLNSGMLKTSDLISSGYAAQLNYAHNDSFNMGFRVSSPLRIEHGNLSVDFANGRDIETDTVYRNQYNASLKPQRREYKFAVYADKQVNDNIALASEFDIRVNPEHRNQSNDYRAIFGLSWVF